MNATVHGRLIYVMGPSGAGKDSLLAFARSRIGARALFAHRYITRPVADGENHIALSQDEFDTRLAHGLFSLHWTTHGHRYAIGIEMETWLASGLCVVVNGSREHARHALERYPGTQCVYIDASPAVLAARLAHRARESAEEIEARLARRLAVDLPDHEQMITIDNSGTLADGGHRLIAIIESACGSPDTFRVPG